MSAGAGGSQGPKRKVAVALRADKLAIDAQLIQNLDLDRLNNVGPVRYKKFVGKTMKDGKETDVYEELLNPETISGERSEFYISTPENRNNYPSSHLGVMFFEKMPHDQKVAWRNFEVAAKISAVRLMEREGIINARQMKFSAFSIIQQPADSPQQPHHIDHRFGAQFVVAITDNIPSTLYLPFEPEPYPLAAEVDAAYKTTPVELTERKRARKGQEDLIEDIAPVLRWSRWETQSKLVKAADILRTGEFTMLYGPVVHAGPASNTKRTIVFFTCSPPDAPDYDPNVQYDPVSGSAFFNNANIMLCRAVEWSLTHEKDVLSKFLSSTTERVHKAVTDLVPKAQEAHAVMSVYTEENGDSEQGDEEEDDEVIFIEEKSPPKRSRSGTAGHGAYSLANYFGTQLRF